MADVRVSNIGLKDSAVVEDQKRVEDRVIIHELVISDKYGLSRQQRDFVTHYITDCGLNEYVAAGKAGYTSTSAIQLMRNDGVRNCINDITKALCVSDPEVLYLLTGILKFNASEIIDKTGRVNVTALREPRNAQLIKSIKVSEKYDKEGNISSVSTNVDLYSKIDAANLIMRAKGMFIDRTETTVNMDVRVLNAAYELLPEHARPEFVRQVEEIRASIGAGPISETTQEDTSDTSGFEDNDEIG